jgi:hypothetical protein
MAVAQFYASRAIREPEPNGGNKGDRSNVVAEEQEPHD